MWYLHGDNSRPVITAEAHVKSAHRGFNFMLPETALIFFMSGGIEHILKTHKARQLSEPFPRFLNRCPIWQLDGAGVCFLDGGRGAPQACDTVETLAALGVKNIVTAGMFGAFDRQVDTGDIVAPSRAYVEEGTSLHYYEAIEYSVPDDRLLALALDIAGASDYPIVSTDAVYRQTFKKEQLWREKGAVGVDMETSVVLSVSAYLGLRAVALVMASDIHPLSPDEPEWEWRITKAMRENISERSLELAKRLKSL